MATRFDELESDIPPSLGDMSVSRGRPGRLKPIDPSVDTFRQRFAPFSADPVGDYIEDYQGKIPGKIVPPGTRERFGDPTKVIAGPLPRNDTPERPPLESFFERPPLESFFEPEKPSKLQRFLKNVTPEGPISGVIGLVRTAGGAAQGRRPDLYTNPNEVIPEAVQGAVIGPGARATSKVLRSPETAAKDLVPFAKERYPGAYSDTQAGEPLKLPDLRTPAQKLEQAQLDTKRVAQTMRDEGRMPPEGSGAPIDLPGPVTPPPPPSPLLPPQLVREFGAVRKGVELKDRLNPESPTNMSAKEQALEAAIRPHLREIEAVGERTSAPMAALEAAVPSLSDAVSTPGRAASVANWVRVYERAARAKFSEQAKASLGLATKNLNNNLGTDITLGDILKGP